MSDWNSSQYIKFEKERTQPTIDLIHRIDIEPKTILDIGCGPGNSTIELKKAFGSAEIIGIDSSENMLESAKQKYPEIEFKKCRVPDELNSFGKYDLLFSNACLQWIPNHESLLSVLMEHVNEGGVLAVQMPLVQMAPFYRSLDRLVEKNWNDLKGIRNFHDRLPNETFDILSRSTSDITMWETHYYHIVPSAQAVIEWYKGSGLRPYLDRLSEDQKSMFLKELLEEIRLDFPMQADGRVLLKMPRFFFIARK
ncbi:MAG: methyltransferase domain-containing protein [Faecalicoccus sp.]|nr:methyltransferase domain-containing protein [Faecalicoccus sp.]